MKPIRLFMIVAASALLLAACSSAGSTGLTTTTSTTPSNSSTTTGSGSTVGVAGVWPSVRTAYGPVGTGIVRVAKDLVPFAATNGAGSTAHLVAALGALSSALATAQQVATHGVNGLSPSAVGYDQLSAFGNAVQAASGSSTSAQSECQTSASSACLAQIQATEAHLKTANRAGAALNALSSQG
jgi:hypothetical protein